MSSSCRHVAQPAQELSTVGQKLIEEVNDLWLWRWRYRYGHNYGGSLLAMVALVFSQGKYVVMCEDYKLREPTHEVMDMVVQARHQLTGYTGHIHGAQHVFAESYGHKTRRLREHPKDYTSDSLIDFADDRPNARPYEVPPLLHYEQDEPQVYHFRDPDEDH
ncbi:hypothetical protein CBR_g32166 [Chara braunii]|uniref:Uncharacterized protein n=1 Tax=Chara braunii TaxID=69332 RepID=A0A388JMV8_CHABU|nr:hypothetical protein CBR_g32166 [Chara braunii]|eukprot:GBG59149.1 hypothetical protein CBR_g32166 [Chara braunii]